MEDCKVGRSGENFGCQIMTITNTILKDLILCPYKAFRSLHEETGDLPQISILYEGLKEDHFNQFVTQTGNKSSIAFRVRYTNARFQLHFDGIEIKSRRKQIALMTLPFEKIRLADKVYLSLLCHVACTEFSIRLTECRIIHGEKFGNTYFKLPAFKKQISALLIRLEELMDDSRAPAFYRNDHCPFCQFLRHCHQAWKERDDLSLLTGMRPKDIISRNLRGIFTVRQLSFTFRPRKNPYGARSYRPELKALAIRDNKPYILEGAKISRQPVEVFLDIEGIPDRKFQYLIGMVIREGDHVQSHSLWADDSSGKNLIFEKMLSILSKYESVTIYHYGSYDVKVLKSLPQLFPRYRDLAAELILHCVNVLAVLNEHVYLPTYSNGLKEVAGYLNYKWDAEDASGLQSIVWRCQWERTNDEDFKRKLIQYNHDDCMALLKVFDWLCSNIGPAPVCDFTAQAQEFLQMGHNRLRNKRLHGH